MANGIRTVEPRWFIFVDITKEFDSIHWGKLDQILLTTTYQKKSSQP